MATMVDNPFQCEGVWLKGNLHTHTTESDGDVSPQERVDQYAAAGYDFLSITDHEVITNPFILDSKGMVLIPGIELVCENPLGGSPYHIVGIGVPEHFRPIDSGDMRESIDALRAVGALPVVAHPYWCGHTVRDLEILEGVLGVEVFNTDCQRTIGKGTSAVHWDQILAQGKPWLALAVDDAHAHPRDTFQGWVMAKCAERSVDAVRDALRTGRFYASTGPTIESIEFDGTHVSVRTSPVAHINFIANVSRGHHARDLDGAPITHAAHTLRGNETYLRVECTDLQGRTAWSPPLFVR